MVPASQLGTQNSGRHGVHKGKVENSELVGFAAVPVCIDVTAPAEKILTRERRQFLYVLYEWQTSWEPWNSCRGCLLGTQLLLPELVHDLQ